MKKLLIIVCGIVCSMTMTARTIVIDGSNAEWDTIPMLTEPGVVGHMLKVAVPQEGIVIPDSLLFVYMVQRVGNFDQPYIDGNKGCEVYVDADNNPSTGTSFKNWGNVGYEYEPNTWDNPSAYNGNILEGSVVQTRAPQANIPCTIIFAENWASSLVDVVIPMTPEQTTPAWKWGSETHHGVQAKSFSYAPLAGTHTIADLWSRHQCMRTSSAELGFNVSGGEQDTEFWGAWTVEVTEGANYTLSANMVSTNGASCDLYLVDVATNEVISTFIMPDAEEVGKGIWQPNGETSLGNWNLSAVPAGKYMLKVKNHVKWSNMILYSVTLTQTTGLSDVKTSPKAIKRMIDGRLVIERGDGRLYNAIGTAL